MPPSRPRGSSSTGVEAGRPRILVGTDAKLVDLIVRLAPAAYPRLAVLVQRRFLRDAAGPGTAT